MGTDNLKVYSQDTNSEFAKLISENLENIILKDNSIVTGTVEKVDDNKEPPKRAVLVILPFCFHRPNVLH